MLKLDITFRRRDSLIAVVFSQGEVKGRYLVNSSEDFLSALDKFLRRYRMINVSLNKAHLRFEGVGMLAERVIHSIIQGLIFNK